MLKEVKKPRTDQELLLELLVHPGWRVFVEHMQMRKETFDNEILRFKDNNRKDDYLKGQRDYAEYIVGYKQMLEQEDIQLESNL